MNAPYILEETKKTPYICFDQNIGKLEISGCSLPANSQDFYEPLLKLIHQYLENPQDKTELVVHFKYFNTSTSKVILRMLIYFETLMNMGKEVGLSWYFDEDDMDMFEAGKIYQASVKIPFNIIASVPR